MIWLALAGCPHPQAQPDPPPRGPGDVEPTLEIETPVRGTFVDDGIVVVRGRVRDDGIVKVIVNQTPAVVSDGTFTATVSVPRGLALLETHAIDTTGHDVRDVRAVLAGPFALADGRTAAPLGVRLGRHGIAALGKTLAASAKALDLEQAARALNPIYEETGCVGARVDISRVTVGAIDVDLAPKQSAIEVLVRIDQVEIKLEVNYRVACLGSSTSMSVRTRARAKTELRVVAGNGRLRTAFPRPDVTLDDFQFEMRGIPGVVESLLRKVTRPAVEVALAQLIQSKLPPLVDAQLTQLLQRPALPQVLGRDLDLVVSPTSIDVTQTGLAIVANTTFAVRGGTTGRYAATRSAAVPAVPASAGDASVWVAADAINQLLSGLWAAKAFDRSLPRDQLGPLAMLLDERVATVELALSLPPTIHTHTSPLELAVGDLLITARDAAGAEVQRFAVSLRTGLAIKPGERTLGTTEATVYAQLLAQHGTLARPLDAASVESIVKGAWSLVASNIDDALAKLPLPGLSKGAQLKSLAASEGAIVLDLDLP